MPSEHLPSKTLVDSYWYHRRYWGRIESLRRALRDIL
jgi:hypothetical protein